MGKTLEKETQNEASQNDEQAGRNGVQIGKTINRSFFIQLMV